MGSGPRAHCSLKPGEAQQLTDTVTAMAAEVVSSTAQAIFQAGLQQDIFAKARTSTSDASSQSSSGMGASLGASSIGASSAGLTVSGILSVANETMPSPRAPDHGWNQESVSAPAASPSVPRTSVVRPQAMNNFYHCKSDSRGEQAMAFWRVRSGELVQYNDSFGLLLDIPAATLQDGFLWSNISVVDQELRTVSLRDESNNALKAINEFTNLVLAGTARYSQISFSFLSGRNRLRHMHVTMVSFHDDILWICSEIGGESNNFVRPAPRRASAPALAGSSDSITLDPRDNERKLVKVATRKKKPWDQNLVKFSLKKMRKRTKRSKSDSPLVSTPTAMST